MIDLEVLVRWLGELPSKTRLNIVQRKLFVVRKVQCVVYVMDGPEKEMEPECVVPACAGEMGDTICS